MAKPLVPVPAHEEALTMEQLHQRTEQLADELLREIDNDDLRRRLIAELFTIMGELRGKRGDATYRQLVLSFDQLFDVVKELNQLPASLLVIAPTMIVLCDQIEKRGWRVKDVMERLLEQVLMGEFHV
jgi:hypothetical protein